MSKNDFNSFSIKDIYKAYYDCRKRKRNTKNALQFEFNLEENLFDLYNDIKNNKYKVTKSICFISKYPKAREIFAANFRDRIVHHLIVNKIENIFSKRFVFDSSASQKGKGVLFAQKRLYLHMKRVTKNFKEEAYFLQMDMKNFFCSINKKILENEFKNYIPEGIYRNLALQILYHDPTTDFLFKGNKKSYTLIKKYKSLFFTPKNKGLAIGNYTSQFFANIYLDKLDNYIKRELKCKFYSRYVDDFVLFSRNKNELKIWREKIKSYTKEFLDIEVNGRKIIMQKVSQGINYVGVVLKPYCIYLRNRTYGNFERVLYRYKNDFLNNNVVDKNIILSQLNSYMGFMKNTNYKSRFLKILSKYEIFLSYYFIFDDEKNIY